MASNTLAGITVLVVDDDPPSVKLFAAVLQLEGCEVRVAGSAEEALSVLAVFHPRVIVLDLVLPMMSGLVFVEQVRANPQTRDAVVIAVSAVNGPSVERMALGAGCVACLRKPVDPSALVQSVVRALRRSP